MEFLKKRREKNKLFARKSILKKEKRLRCRS